MVALNQSESSLKLAQSIVKWGIRSWVPRFKNDRVIYVHTSEKTSFDDSGIPVRLDGIIQDITNSKRAEEQIKTLSLVASDIINRVLIFDPETKNYIGEE